MPITVLSAEQAIKNAHNNSRASWNRSPSSSDQSTHPEDVSNRIFDGYAKINPSYSGTKLRKDSPVFAMGSCFAREIERALTRAGGRIISVDKRIDRPEFSGTAGQARNGFFHRFTPFAMLQEFQQAFGEIPSWDEDSLLIDNGKDVIDLNYWDVTGADTSRQSTLIRRRIAAELVREVINADIVILTLGLTESLFHKPSGLHANKVPGITLARRSPEFDLHIISFEETLHCLNEINALISRHRTTPFQLVVTVSPVPLTKTFTADDLVIANMTSKSTLRAAAAAFCAATENATYFPSYEIVLYSDVALAWRPDRMHVQPAQVEHIVSTFITHFYGDGELRSTK